MPMSKEEVEKLPQKNKQNIRRLTKKIGLEDMEKALEGIPVMQNRINGMLVNFLDNNSDSDISSPTPSSSSNSDEEEKEDQVGNLQPPTLKSKVVMPKMGLTKSMAPKRVSKKSKAIDDKLEDLQKRIFNVLLVDYDFE